MQRANFGKPFATKTTSRIVELLTDKPKSIQQLAIDVFALTGELQSSILNTINLLIDSEIIIDIEGRLNLSDQIILSGNPVENSIKKLSEIIISPLHIANLYTAVFQDKELGLYIDGTCIPQKFFTYPHILHSLGIVDSPRNSRFWPINTKYSSFFITKMAELLDKPWEGKKGMSEEELEKKLQHQVKAGKAAEEWVMKSEIERLKSHPYQKKITRVSSIDVTAGFDIASFKNANSFRYDKFIEVKSFSGNTDFFISPNEVNKAKELAADYYLVLVDRDRMNDAEYSPLEICNPFIMLMSGPKLAEIEMEPSGWRVRINPSQPSAGESH